MESTERSPLSARNLCAAVSAATSVFVTLFAPSVAAFGPPSAVVVRAEVAPAVLDRARFGFELAIEIESLEPRLVRWHAYTSASANWDIWTNTVLEATGLENPEIRIGVTASNSKCPPLAAVIELVLDDPSGSLYEVRERFFVQRTGVSYALTSFDDYAKAISIYDSGYSDHPGCNEVSGDGDAKLANAISTGSGGATFSLLAVNRTIKGKVVFWDSRNKRSNASGSRLPTCNTSALTCTPNSANCCVRGVPFASVIIRRTSPTIHVFTTFLTDATGDFNLVANGEPDTATYSVTINLVRTNSQFPGPLRVQTSTGASVNITPGSQSTSGSVLDFGNIPFNAPGDTTSAYGDQATLFVAGTEAFLALEDEGETRHHVGNGLYNTFRHGSGSNSTDCDDHTAYVQAAYSRSVEAIHLLGFLYLGAVVGCTGNNPTYPTYYPGGYDRYTAEGNALRVGVPSLLLTLSRWDPDVASTSDIFTALYPCRTDGYNNANRASDERNNWHGLWELVDTNTGNQSGVGDDLSDITLPELMDGLVDLQSTSGTDNHTGGEQVLTEVPWSICFSADDCASGNACVGYICYSGDPHGENVLDMVWALGIAQGGWSALANYVTLISSPCLGEEDDTYPYTGGFRLD